MHLFLTDNLSAHDLLCFQTNFNSGTISRLCLIDYSQIKSPVSFDVNSCQLREEEEHLTQVATSENNATAVKAEFGITRKCIFDGLDYVKVVELISPDVVHDFMEGVVPTVICISFKCYVKCARSYTVCLK